MSAPASDPAPGERSPLTNAYRVIRRLAPADGPAAGTLARSAEGGTVVLVDAATTKGWLGWACDDPHVLGPIDVALTYGGCALVLPWCVERVDRLIARRIAAGSPLTSGESVTIAVSLVRGIAALAFAARSVEADPAGSWWLTDDARPVFVHLFPGGASAETAAGTATALIDSLRSASDDPALARALELTREAIREPRSLQRHAERLESALFSAAAPQPVETSTFGPARARDVDAASGRPIPIGARVDTTSRGARAAVPLLDDGLADLVSSAIASAARWVRARRRLAVWSVAAVVGVTVLGAGLAWPDSASPPAAAENVSTPTASATTLGDDSLPEPSPTPDAPVSGDSQSLEAAVARLLTARTSCRDDGDCLAAVIEDPAVVLPPGVVDAPDTERKVVLLDEFGGAAVLRVESRAGDLPPQLVVVVRGDDGWLLRDVHDAAQQAG